MRKDLVVLLLVLLLLVPIPLGIFIGFFVDYTEEPRGSTWLLLHPGFYYHRGAARSVNANAPGGGSGAAFRGGGPGFGK